MHDYRACRPLSITDTEFWSVFATSPSSPWCCSASSYRSRGGTSSGRGTCQRSPASSCSAPAPSQSGDCSRKHTLSNSDDTRTRGKNVLRLGLTDFGNAIFICFFFHYFFLVFFNTFFPYFLLSYFFSYFFLISFLFTVYIQQIQTSAPHF